MENCIERWGGPVSSRRSYGNHNVEKNERNNFFAARQQRRNNNGAGLGGRNRYSFPHAPNFYATSSSAGNPSTPWKRLLSQKAVVLEPKSTSDLKDAISEFERFIDEPTKSTGCVLMGVCRGKISEGIDFANEKCRAVVIAGLPVAPCLVRDISSLPLLLIDFLPSRCRDVRHGPLPPTPSHDQPVQPSRRRQRRRVIPGAEGEEEEYEFLEEDRMGFGTLRALLLSAPLPGGRDETDDAGLNGMEEKNSQEEEEWGGDLGADHRVACWALVVFFSLAW